MSSAIVSRFVQVQGDGGAVIKNVNQTRTVTADGLTSKEPTLGAAKVGQLTTRTDANTGTLTMAASHGITTGARLDLYWDGGSRYGIVVGTVSVNSVPIDLGSGDDLPANLTAITAMVPQNEAITFGFASLQTLVGYCAAAAATIVLVEEGDAEPLAILTGINNGYVWDAGDDADNPVDTFTITNAYFSHGDSSASHQVGVIALVN